jgi:hypothetical protein
MSESLIVISCVGSIFVMISQFSFYIVFWKTYDIVELILFQQTIMFERVLKAEK